MCFNLLLLVHLSLIFVFFTSSFGTHGISISDARQEKSVLPPPFRPQKAIAVSTPCAVLVHSPSVDEVSMACSSTSVFQQHRRLFKMMRSCIVSLNVAEIGWSTVELSNTGNTVAKPSVFVTAPSWCLVLEVSPLGVPSKGFSYFFMDKKVKEKMSFALLHQTLKRGLARASLRMKLMPAAHSPCLVRLSASLVAGPKEVWSIKVRSPFGSPFEVKVKRTCSGRNLWLQVVLATEKLAGRGTVDIDSLYDGNRHDCPLCHSAAWG